MAYRIPFDRMDKIQQTYSQAGQDIFVLMALNGKQNGTYLEIGAGEPVYVNNTYLLETVFDWKGVAIDNQTNYVNAHRQVRKHQIVLSNAEDVDYPTALIQGGITSKTIDYLSLDLDGESTINAMYKLPLDTHKFVVITFEHDAYRFGDRYKNLSREHFKRHGYELVVSNVFLAEAGDFEDWWIHPDLVEPNRINLLTDNGIELTNWVDYVAGK